MPSPSKDTINQLTTVAVVVRKDLTNQKVAEFEAKCLEAKNEPSDAKDVNAQREEVKSLTN